MVALFLIYLYVFWNGYVIMKYNVIIYVELSVKIKGNNYMKKQEEAGNFLYKCMNRFYAKINENFALQCVRESLTLVVPIIMLGAIALTLQSFPLEIYQDFICNFANGIIYNIFNLLYTCTFGALSLYMCVSVSWCYASHIRNLGGYVFAPVLTSFFCFIIMSGVLIDESAGISAIGQTGIFTAIITGFLSTKLFFWFKKHIKFNMRFFTNGEDAVFHYIVEYLPTVFLTMLVFIGLTVIIQIFSPAESFHSLYILFLNKMFEGLGRNFLSMFLYILVIHVLWFFGIHGSNALASAGETLLGAAVDESLIAATEQLTAADIYSKTFGDIYIFMGGCGSTLCLLLAILIFGKKHNLKSLAAVAAIPSIFNMNELLLLGVPIIFNPFLLIPFFLTPLAGLTISTLATVIGLVPVPTQAVEWTTPVILGGYYATGSVAGSILQVVIIAVGVLIYMPFVRMLDKAAKRNSDVRIKQLVKILQQSEESRIPVELLELRGEEGALAKVLADDLKMELERKQPNIYYQPQCDPTGTCIGVEALLRWEHPVYGMIYPPVMVKLAEELNLLSQMEMDVLESVLNEMDEIKSIFGDKVKVSVNVTGTTIQTKEYEVFLRHIQKTYPEKISNLLLEITEQAALFIDEDFINKLESLKQIGYRFGIDDFSMGNTSIKYLQTSIFSLIKLDGSLSRDILTNKRSKDIVAMLAKLSNDFGLQIVAEFVETEEQRQELEEMGCYIYQGYLYGPALPLEKLKNFVKKK